MNPKLLKEAARQKRLREETRFQRWRRISKEYVIKKIRLIVGVFLVICGLILAKFLIAFDWLKDKAKKFYSDSFNRAVTNVIGFFLGCTLLGWAIVLGLQVGGVVSSEPTSALVVSEDRCWLLYGQTTSISSSNRLVFDVGEADLWVKDWDVIEFQGSDWESARKALGRETLDLDNCVKDGKVFDETEH